MNRRTRLFTLSMVSGLSAAACAAIIGIDDRSVGSSDASDEDTASADDGSPIGDDAKVPPDGDAGIFLPDARCASDACAAAGGFCADGKGCYFECATGCTGKVIACPPDHDCSISCGGKAACNGIQCSGGHSCTIDCVGEKSCTEGASCSSESCTFLCRGKDACQNVFVDSGSCAISCTGEKACSAEGAISCGPSADASIECANVVETCKDAVPTCDGGHCEIACLHESSCAKGYCCNATDCEVGAAKADNVCQKK